MIIIDKICKNFADTIALKDVSLKFERQETSVILGPSGSGKSTLLRCITNLETPSSGKIEINGKRLNKRSRRKLCSQIGMVFQQFNLFPHLNVMENLLYAPTHVTNVSLEKLTEKAHNLLTNFGIAAKAFNYPKELSGGQKQRVAICRALMMQPKTILFDEPTSALDPEVIKDIIEIINNLKSQIQMIIITHHTKFAKIIADRIIFMDKGLVLCDQPAEEFFAKPNSHRARIFLDNVGDLM